MSNSLLSFPQAASALHSGIGLEASWIHNQNNNNAPTRLPKPYFSSREDQYGFDSRDLGSGDDMQYLVDEDGNAYEPYSTAWRYLGAFIECEDDDGDDDDNSNSKDRRLSGSDEGNGCARKVLWAAYHDLEYNGGSIGEYSYYNRSTGEYDEIYCKAERCARMDCHERDTHFELIGVFKETDGFEDFAEQLFKHEGYCLWDYDTYSLMSTYRQNLPYYCQQLYFPDDSGNTLYLDLKPTARGNIDLGIYTDEQCTKVSRTTTMEDYIEMFYNSKSGDSNDENNGAKIARAWRKAIKRWNKHMEVYKICQPCRAHFLPGGVDYEEEERSGSGDRQDRRRLENDGEGDEEQFGYDCYDDAGYTNCNQCYKFETQTDMEPATIQDLKAATRQGTMLEVIVNGKRYGRGGFRPLLPQWAILTGMVVGGILVLVLCWLLCKRVANSRMLGTSLEWIKACFRGQDQLPSAFREHFHIEAEKTVDFEDDDGYYHDGLYGKKKPLSYVYE